MRVGTDLRQALMLAAALALTLLIIALFATLLPASDQRYLNRALIEMLVVVGLYIFVGNSGVLSFGHISFMAIGAYVTAWLVIPPDTKELLLPGLPAFLASAQWPSELGVLAGGIAASVFALIVGVPLMRLSGISASIATFALLAIVNAVASNWTAMTGGQSSLYGLPSYSGTFIALAWVVAAIVGAAVYQASGSGFRLRGSREDEVAARAAGVNVPRERLVAFVVSAFFVGVAGGLYAHLLGVVVAKEFYLKWTFITVAMLVIGGMRSLTGAVVGVMAVSLVSEMLRRAERGIDLGFIEIPGRPGVQEVLLALAMLLILVYRPRGLTGGRELPLPRWRRRRGGDVGP